MTQIRQGLCTLDYVEFDAGLHFTVQNVQRITFMGHNMHICDSNASQHVCKDAPYRPGH